MNTILKRDSRLFNYQHNFGTTTIFLPTLFVDSGDQPVQPIGNVQCTVYTATDVGKGENGKDYPIDDVWNEMLIQGKASTSGASPQDAFAAMTSLYSSDFTSYYQTDVGIFDFFFNVKSAIQNEYNLGRKRPNGCGTYWYQEWNGLSPGSIMPMPKTKVSNHEWEVTGWDELHGDMFRIKAWTGCYYWIPREVFNFAMDDCYGTVALTLATSSQEVIDFNKAISVSKWNLLMDTCYNILQSIKALFALPLTPAVENVITSQENNLDKIMLENNIPPTTDFNNPPEAPQPQISPVPDQPAPISSLDWSTPLNSRHSVRVICDDEGLSVADKNDLCATVDAESGFKTTAVCLNLSNGTAISTDMAGKDTEIANAKTRGLTVSSTDFGICQWNDYYHGKEITPDEAVNNPEMAVRLMCQYWKRGQQSQWVGFSSGNYKQYL